MSELKFISKEPVDKGWSCDKKYCVTTADGTKYLLRITPEAKSASRWDMFRMQQKVADLGIPMCRSVEIGRCDEGVYILQTWIDGKDAEAVGPYLA
ncbi:MAG: aminoglycoside phosphotransferase family protein, partial [Acetatifactor sp.]|nr:aminoglycoside phosphotransferase family protein [Acetatifactor sp.]